MIRRRAAAARLACLLAALAATGASEARSVVEGRALQAVATRQALTRRTLAITFAVVWLLALINASATSSESWAGPKDR